MAGKTYLDFDMSIERVGERYRARVLDSPAGEATIEFRGLPFSVLELENLRLRVSRPQRGVVRDGRRVDRPEDTEAIKTFGGRLFAAVFDNGVQGCLRSSLDEAGRQGLGLRIRLRLADAPELADLPWEYLYNRPLNRFLCLSNDTPLVRYLDLPEPIRPLQVTRPLRVLVMIASPTDYPRLDVDQEWARLSAALADLEQRGQVTLERLEEATLAALQRRLRRNEYHIFHFIGHGDFAQQTQDGMLILEDEAARGRPVSGGDLGTVLHDHRSLRLALLNACEGARTSRGDSFAGAAQRLVQQGIPAVIAMQFEITDTAAITLAHEFYGAIADGYPVDAALAEARKAIFAQGNNVEWATPVLYMRAPDGRIFNVEAVSTADQGQLPAAPAPVTAAANRHEPSDRALTPPAAPGGGRRPWLPIGVAGALILLIAVLALRGLGIGPGGPAATAARTPSPSGKGPAVTPFAIRIGEGGTPDVPGPGAGILGDPGATDVYTFSADPGQVVYFQVEQTDDSDIRWRAVDGAGTFIFDTCLGCGDPGVRTLRRGGTYTITVGNDQQPAAGAYAFRLWSAPPTEEFAITINDSVTVAPDQPGAGAGMIESPGAKDVYTFSADPGQVVYIEPLEAAHTQMPWRAVDEAGTVLFDTCLMCSHPGLTTLQRGGTYTLTVGSDRMATPGDYQFRIWSVPSPDEFTIALGDTVSPDVPGPGAGSIERPGARDVYTFTASPGQVASFQAQEADDPQMYWRLEDEAGTVIFDQCLGCSEASEQSLQRGGTYTITVHNDQRAGTGTYQFRTVAR